MSAPSFTPSLVAALAPSAVAGGMAPGAIAGSLPQVAAPGRSLEQVFAQSARPTEGKPPALEALASQVQQRRGQQATARRAASSRVQTILDAVQQYTGSPKAKKRQRAGTRTLSGY